jgi:hypothetical protein
MKGKYRGIFGLDIFTLIICHWILPKINCITLKIRSKADFKSKSQNIWQQTILFSSTVMQMICAWHKQARTHSWQWLLKNLSVSCRMNQFLFCNYSYVVHTEYIYIYIFQSTEHCAWAIISPERVQILCHAHIICITVLENRIVCCQIFCDLLLKSAFERIFNVMLLNPHAICYIWTANNSNIIDK